MPTNSPLVNSRFHHQPDPHHRPNSRLEAWGWMQPARHALGALLLERGNVEEAEAVYRSDLGLDGKLSRACQHPDNLWSLHGLHECLARRGEIVEAALIRQSLDLAMARAEIPVKASCFCRQVAMAAE